MNSLVSVVEARYIVEHCCKYVTKKQNNTTFIYSDTKVLTTPPPPPPLSSVASFMNVSLGYPAFKWSVTI